MANIMDLFKTNTEVSEIHFDVEGAKRTYERMKSVQQAIGGTPTIKAKVGSGGVKLFTIAAGNKEAVIESFSGVIIANHKCNALFPSDSENLNQPPICSSMDGVNGINSLTGEICNCESCPHNMFGSSGNGKECKNMHRLYIMTENNAIPVMLAVPPTSLELWHNYALMDVAAQGYGIEDVVTEFSLTNTVSTNGQKYCLINFKMLGTINDEARQFCMAVGSAIETVQKPAITEGDYNRSESIPKLTAENVQPSELPKQSVVTEELCEEVYAISDDDEEVDINDL